MKKIRFLLKFFCFFYICFVTFNIFIYTYAYISPKINLKSANQITIYDNNNEIAFLNIDGNKWVKLSDISNYVIDGTIAIEDKNFYTHNGFDYLRIIKAMYENIINGSIVQGASTISQQYVKNLYLSFDKTWSRKIEEAFLTLELEVHYDKDDIIEGYLNTINYGNGNYGIEKASLYYFNKPSKDLSLSEASILVGIPKNPTLYNPINNYENAKNRQKMVLDSMVKNNYITQEEANDAYNEEVEFYGKNEVLSLVTLNYYRDAVLNELNNIPSIPKSLIKTGGLKIYTNLDLEVQKILEDNIKTEMDENDELEVASIVIEPSTGKILALVGGKDYNKTQFNRATQAYRQVGSTFKPILYYSALENGFTSSSTFYSEETVFSIGDNQIYSPKNYGNKYANKDITLAAAIAYSDNIYAIKTNLFLGPDLLVDTAKRMGLKKNIDANVSLPLGTSELSMIDYSNVYTTLANYGIKNNGNYLINKVTDLDGNIIYEHKYEEEQVLNQRYIYILNELLTNTYNYSFIDYSSPTMISINGDISKKYSVKSGSTDYDYWAIGYNPDILVMVWNGYDDNSKIETNKSKITKKIWAKSIDEILKDKKESWYEIPDGVTGAFVDPINGEGDGNKYLLYYVKGTEPIN